MPILLIASLVQLNGEPELNDVSAGIPGSVILAACMSSDPTAREWAEARTNELRLADLASFFDDLEATCKTTQEAWRDDLPAGAHERHLAVLDCYDMLAWTALKRGSLSGIGWLIDGLQSRCYYIREQSANYIEFAVLPGLDDESRARLARELGYAIQFDYSDDLDPVLMAMFSTGRNRFGMRRSAGEAWRVWFAALDKTALDDLAKAAQTHLKKLVFRDEVYGRLRSMRRVPFPAATAKQISDLSEEALAVRGDWKARLELLRQAMKLIQLEGLGPSSMSLNVIANLASAQLAVGDLSGAYETYEYLVEFYSQHDYQHPVGLFEAYSSLAVIAVRRGKQQDALRWFGKAFVVLFDEREVGAHRLINNLINYGTALKSAELQEGGCLLIKLAVEFAKHQPNIPRWFQPGEDAATGCPPE